MVITFPLLPDTITITHKDSRWVGAWWMGFLITGTVALLSSIPFFFLPKSLPKQEQEEEQSQNKSTELETITEQENFLPEKTQEKPVKFLELAKGNILFNHLTVYLSEIT